MIDPREVLLVLNAGSASIKFCTFERAGESLERGLGGQVSTVDHAVRLVATRGPAVIADLALGDGPLRHADALVSLLEFLGAELDGTPIAGVGHRVVHGGIEFTEPTVVDSSTLARLDRYVPLAPLHQPHNLDAIRQVAAVLPGVPQVACFDTSFHRSVPEVAQLFALPPRFADAGVRRYGFHGLSYEYVASVSASARSARGRGPDGRLSPRQWRQHVRDARLPQRRHDDGLHGRRWAADGHAQRVAGSGRGAVPAG